MKRRPVLFCLGYLAATVAGFVALLCGVGWLMRPDMSARPAAHDPEEVHKVRESREVRMDAEHPPVPSGAS
jgi:hypothetical protein